MQSPIPCPRRHARDDAETLLARAEFLGDEERSLIEQVLAHGVRPSQIASVRRCTPRAVQRRVQRIRHKLSDPATLYILRNAQHWSPVLRQVALRVLVRGQTMRTVGHELGLTLHEVRKHTLAARCLAENANTAHGRKERHP